MSLPQLDSSHCAQSRRGFLHLGVNNPVEVFIAFVRSSRASLDGTEQPRMPFNSLVSTFSGFVSLAIFNFGFFVGCSFVILGQNRLNCFFP